MRYICPVPTKKGHNPEEVDRMQQAWGKAVTLHVTFRARPYCKDGEW
jgi:hypothetical protein